GQRGHDGHQAGHEGVEQRPRRAQRLLQLRQIDRRLRRADGGGRRGSLAHRAAPPVWASARLTIHSPRVLANRGLTSKTPAAAMRTARSICEAASGNLLASRAARVLAGANTDTLSDGTLPTSMARAMVSPMARPKPRMIEPYTPRLAVGSSTDRMVSQR